MKQPALRHLLVLLIGVAAAVIPINILAAPGDIYVPVFNTGEIWSVRLNPVSLAFKITGLNGPRGLAFDGSGNLFEADQSSGTIYKITAPNIKTVFAAGLSGPTGLAFDASGNLFEVDQFSSTIFKFTPDGTKSTFASGLNAPVSLAFDSAGNLFVGEQGSASILKFTPDGTKSTFATGLNDPEGLAFDKAGNLFVAEFVSGSIFKITPEGAQSTFVSGLDGPNALAFDSSGNLWEAEYFGKRIVRYNSNGTSTEFIGFMDLGPFGLAIEPMPHALLNISTRGFVRTGDAVLIGGFIVGGNGLLSGKVLIRAAGPSMTAAGVAGTLQDPVLRLFNSSGAVIASNNNWKDTQQALIQATGLTPTDDRESAIVASLPAGAYTAIVTGANNTTGVARVDVFNVQ